MYPDPNDPAFHWPLDPGDPGREVWYSIVGAADGSVAVWHRYTLLSTTSGRQEGRLWAALTDREAPGESTFVSESVALEDVWTDRQPFELAVGDGVLTSTSSAGEVGPVSWDLGYDPDTFVFTPLRSALLTNVLAKTAGTGKHWSRNQSVSVSGTVTVGDRTVELHDAPGHQGHTVSGASPPEEWTWVLCNDFEADDSVVLEALRLDGTLSVCLRVDGRAYPLNRLAHVLPFSPRANRTDHDEVGHWRFRGSGDGVELQATVEADPDHWRLVAYKVPDGSVRYNAHCSLSSVTLTFDVDGGENRTLTSDAARAEWVDTEPPVDGEYRPDWE